MAHSNLTQNQPTDNRCSYCGTPHDFMFISAGSYQICSRCQELSFNLICNYSYKPQPKFHGNHTRFFGVEVEVVPGVNTPQGKQIASLLVKGAMGTLAYLKRDGSVTSGGFEIVTHPFTLSQMRSKKIFTGLKGLPIKSFSDASCGTHVHVSRKALTALQLSKLVYFFSLPENEDFLKYVGQRDWNHYCRKLAVTSKGQLKNALRGFDGRYHAINFCNDHTVEFRFFKGNANPSAIYRAVQFCDAILDYMKITAAHNLSYAGFIQFVNKTDNGEYKYRHLRSYLNKYRAGSGRKYS